MWPPTLFSSVGLILLTKLYFLLKWFLIIQGEFVFKVPSPWKGGVWTATTGMYRFFCFDLSKSPLSLLPATFFCTLSGSIQQFLHVVYGFIIHYFIIEYVAFLYELYNFIGP